MLGPDLDDIVIGIRFESSFDVDRDSDSDPDSALMTIGIRINL